MPIGFRAFICLAIVLAIECRISIRFYTKKAMNICETILPICRSPYSILMMPAAFTLDGSEGREWRNALLPRAAKYLLSRQHYTIDLSGARVYDSLRRLR